MSDEDLDYITSLSSTFLPIPQIAILLDMDPDVLLDLLEDEQSEVYLAYQKGRIQTEFDLRKSVFDLAKAGSSPAQALAVQFMQTDKRKTEL